MKEGGARGIRGISGIKETISPLYPYVSLYWGTEGDKGDILYLSLLYHDYVKGRDKGDKGDGVPLIPLCLPSLGERGG